MELAVKQALHQRKQREAAARKTARDLEALRVGLEASPLRVDGRSSNI